MNIRTDYSFLFSGLNSSSGTAGSSGTFANSFLSDYMSIKNGSYHKLLKAYYAKDDGSDKSFSISQKDNISMSADSAKDLASIKNDAEALKESADALLTTGSKSLFREKEITTKDENGAEIKTKGYDKDAIYKGVKSFVDDYNALLKSAGDSNSNSILRQTANMVNYTKANSRLLSKAGITIGSDNTLTIDEKTFQESDMTTVKSLFNGHSSLAYRTSASASMLDYTAGREAEKANTYTAKGGYSNNYSSGSIFADYF